jgi:CheY-like chemotaxis protein
MDNRSSGTQGHAHRSIVVVSSKTQELLVTSLLLQRFDYEVSPANTVSQALEIISIVVPSLVITDMVLPGMSGMFLFHLLKQGTRTANIPMVFVIPAGDSIAERVCLDAGAAGCIAKPVHPEDLYRIVQTAIEPTPRASIRIETPLVVSVNNIPLDRTKGERVTDLSEQGMYIPVRSPYPRNERLMLQIRIRNRTISAEASVLYSHASNVGPYKEPGMGLKFTSIAPDDQEFIRKYIHDQVTQGLDAA